MCPHVYVCNSLSKTFKNWKRRELKRRLWVPCVILVKELNAYNFKTLMVFAFFFDSVLVWYQGTLDVALAQRWVYKEMSPSLSMTM